MTINLKYLRFLVFGMVLSSLIFTACGDDDEPEVPGGGDGLNVSDGFYFSEADEDPTFEDVLVSEVVEDDGFGSQERTGFIANFMYLQNDNHVMYNVKDKEIANTYGGTVETVTDEGSGCDYNDYYRVAVAVDGASVPITTQGFYKITYDQKDSEMLAYKIEELGIIGSATEGGWGTDTKLTGSVDENGGSWSASDVILRNGEMKLRFNCRWGINERHDDDNDGQPDGWTIEDGYQVFINFGGSASDLVPGGANIAVTEDGTYDVKVDWDPIDGFSMDVDRTGDAPEITFVPDEHQWALVGDAINSEDADGDGTPDGWQTDLDLNYEGFDSGSSTYTWKSNGAVTFGEGGFKFRTNDAWDENIGWGQVELTGDVDGFSDDNGNIKVSADGAGDYNVVLTTSDDGESYTASFEKQ